MRQCIGEMKAKAYLLQRLSVREHVLLGVGVINGPARTGTNTLKHLPTTLFRELSYPSAKAIDKSSPKHNAV